MMKRIIFAFFIFHLLSQFATAQGLQTKNYNHSTQTYPTFFSTEGNRSYAVTIAFENGAAADWKIDEQNLLKRCLTLEGMLLTDQKPAFKVDVKLYRHEGFNLTAEKVEGRMPIAYKISDSKGKVLLLVDTMDKNNIYKAISANTSQSIQLNIDRILQKLSDDIKTAIDFAKWDLSNYTYFLIKDDNPEFAQFIPVQNEMESFLNNKILAPNDVLNSTIGKSALVFWKKQNDETIKSGNNKIRRLTTINITMNYLFNCSVDSAAKWLIKLEREEGISYRVSQLRRYLSLQRENIKKYEACIAAKIDNKYYSLIKAENLKYINSRIEKNQPFKPKETEGFTKDEITYKVAGYVYQRGIKINGNFIVDRDKKFDINAVNFQADSEKAPKLISPILIDSVVLDKDKFVRMPNSGFSLIMVDNPVLKILHYIPKKQTANDMETFYFEKKKKKELGKFIVGTAISYDRFLSKFFSDCPFVVKTLTKEGYQKGNYAATFLKVAEDFSLNCK